MKLALATAASLLALTIASHAADAVVEEPVPMPVEVFTWTGAYIGAVGGYAGGDREYTLDANTLTTFRQPPVSSFFDLFDGDDEADLSSDGGFIGAQVGYDYQSGNWVFGAVADIAYTSNEAEYSYDVGGREVIGDGDDFDILAVGEGDFSSRLNYLGTVRGRVGYAMDRALIYAHGGFAYGEMEYEFDDGLESGEDHDNKTGYTVGAGVEYAFTDHLSGQLEYSFVDLGEDEIANDFRGSVDEDVKLHLVKFGLNFRF